MTKDIIVKISKALFVVSAVILGLLIINNIDNKDFFINYLSVFTYFISLSIGATFFIVLFYLTRGGWGVAVKRVPDHIMSLLPLYAILFIPILFGLDVIFEWLDVAHVSHDQLLQAKQPYLNLPFFVIRNIIYFIVFSVISLHYWKQSIRQDTANANFVNKITSGLQRKAPVSILLLSLTTSFASFDWLMSLFPHWFSTIFGIYFFAGAIVFFLSVTILCYEGLRYYKFINEYPNTEHFHDLTKLLYGFVIFWAYIGFSQYFLTWYANIPEFTQWYYPRIHGEWEPLFYILIIFHFIVPLFAFMSRHVKRHPVGRIIFASLMIIVHYLDIRFLIYPNFMKENFISMNEYLLILLFAIMMISLLIIKFTKYNILPIKDPRLAESKKLENSV